MGGITTITINKVKYIGIASLTIAILSVLTLNIISSYSSSNIESNAIDSNSEPSTLANDSSICNPTNTNAAACISLSITSSSSSSTGGNDANLSLSIPQGGGIATGRHTVEVSSNNVTGYYVSLNAKSDTTDLVNTNDDGTVNKDHVITSLPVENDFLHPTVLSNNTWGVALPGKTELDCVNSDNCSIDGTRYVPDEYEYEYLFNFEENYKDTNLLANVLFASIPPQTGFTTNVVNARREQARTSRDIYYGVRVDNPNELLAGNYQAEVVYTATTNEVPAPTIDSLNQNSYELGSNTNLDSNNRLPITITGTNLESTYNIYLENNTDSSKQYDLTNNVASVTDTQLKLTLPTDITNSDLEPGEYTIHVVTQGGEETIEFSYTKKTLPPLPDGINTSESDYGDDGRVSIDWDNNMIPVYYSGAERNERWTSLTKSQIQSNPQQWYDYSKKQWANAVTVKASAINNYKNRSTTVDPDDILGYWVYVPRYAYKVMRKETSDKFVQPQNFEIKFETRMDTKKQPVACTSSNSEQYYQDCPGVNNAYGAATGTSWSTHPAFTFGETELDGFWVGKFEMTGSRTSPTILPNYWHYSGSNGYGELYDVAKSIGYPDSLNKGGSGTRTTSNAHNLQIDKSHMMKSNEWGATVYLANSKFGAGIDDTTHESNIQPNQLWPSDGSGKDGNGSSSGGITGCGPEVAGKYENYKNSTKSVIGTHSACYGPNDYSHGYNGSLGMLASTTNNITGIYDMSGGGEEAVAGAYAPQQGKSYTNEYFTNAGAEPYLNLYYGRTSDSTEQIFNSCTYATCGGQALHETSGMQTHVNTNTDQMWGGSDAFFIWPSFSQYLGRGISAGYNDMQGIFGMHSYSGYASSDYTTRVVLAAY